MFSLGPGPEDVRVVPGITEGCALAAEAQRRKHLPALLALVDFREARSREGDSQTDTICISGSQKERARPCSGSPNSMGLSKAR